MDSFLLRSFQEHSVLWVLISAGLGGIIGALIKFLFETVAALRYQQEVTARKMLRKYRYPLLRAADSLDRRLENMITFIDKKWYEDPQDYLWVRHRHSTIPVEGGRNLTMLFA